MLGRLAQSIDATMDATPRTHRGILVRGWSRYSDLISNLRKRGILLEFDSNVPEPKHLQRKTQ